MGRLPSRQGRRRTMMRLHRRPRLLCAMVGLLALGVSVSHADGPPRRPVTMTGMRSWSAPEGTRLVFDFSSPVTPVAPDSGVTRELAVSIPGEQVVRSDAVPTVLGVRDGVVDSVLVTTNDGGGMLRLWFRNPAPYHLFTLRPDQDKPFRVVIDISRPGAEAAQDKRLAVIATTKKQERLRVVAVDPGHGGEDTGARGPGGILEKSTNLAVARALVDQLNLIPGVRGVLTRDGDYFIPLHERYHIAEKMKADLFISIHANSSRRRGSGRGTEVYFLSLRGASDQADKDLADAENAADLVGGVPPQAEDDLVGILYDVKRSSALQQSQLLAETLLDHVATDRRLEVRGIKQAGFVVLKSVEFPSVLVETAFINNPTEARLLNSPDFQRQLGRQLATGVQAYFQKSGIGLSAPTEGTATSAGGR
jgi:N-acetylmuramoyl-L-alanine amidase